MKGLYIVEEEDIFYKKIQYRFKDIDLNWHKDYTKLLQSLKNRLNIEKFFIEEYAFILDYGVFFKEEDLYIQLYREEGIKLLEFLTANGVQNERIFVFTRLLYNQVPWELFPKKYRNISYLNKSQTSGEISDQILTKF